MSNSPNIIVFCKHGTREKCYEKSKLVGACRKVHFKKIIFPHTDETLGNCSYLDTCRHMECCKFIHYRIDEIDEMNNPEFLTLKAQNIENLRKEEDNPPQWINCDLRDFDFRIFQNFCNVVMMDPPWDIHMNVN